MAAGQPGLEAASRRRGKRARTLGGDGPVRPRVIGMGRQRGGEEGLGVRVHRPGAQRVAGRRLDDLAEIENRQRRPEAVAPPRPRQRDVSC